MIKEISNNNVERNLKNAKFEIIIINFMKIYKKPYIKC